MFLGNIFPVYLENDAIRILLQNCLLTTEVQSTEVLKCHGHSSADQMLTQPEPQSVKNPRTAQESADRLQTPRITDGGSPSIETPESYTEPYRGA